MQVRISRYRPVALTYIEFDNNVTRPLDVWRPRYVPTRLADSSISFGGAVLNLPKMTNKNQDSVKHLIEKGIHRWLRRNPKLPLVLQAPGVHCDNSKGERYFLRSHDRVLKR